jgi:SNF2 family DNA or RNA helicase
MVHRFITKNTFEEKINDMIQQKKALAEMTVATGENWIGNLSNKELRDIFSI